MSNEQRFDGDGFDWLIGRRIVSVEDAVAPADTYMETGGYLLTCDDGTQLLTYENEGCGGCGNGWSSLPDLKRLADHDNAITNVEAVYDDHRDGYGNGYYGGGFYLRVIEPTEVTDDGIC